MSVADRLSEAETTGSLELRGMHLQLFPDVEGYSLEDVVELGTVHPSLSLSLNFILGGGISRGDGVVLMVMVPAPLLGCAPHISTGLVGRTGCCLSSRCSCSCYNVVAIQQRTTERYGVP
jgi:hypothetical protein